MSDQIVADYDRLEQLANRFSNRAQMLQQMLQHIRSNMDSLQGEWVGRGSDAFFSEMEGEVLPATDRLRQALEEAHRVTNTIVRVMEQADEEASSPLRSFSQ